MNNREKVNELYAQGIAKAEIARRVGISRERVSQIIGKPEEPQKKERARRLAKEAIISGKIKKQPCIVCGNKDAEGHHADYDKPLNLIWLCKLHHNEIHGKKILITEDEKKEAVSARKRKQREAIRAWIVKQTGGRITTAEGYVMELMKQNRSAK